MCVERALIDIVTVDAIARVPWWTYAGERACGVRAVVHVKAVVCTGGAFVDLSASVSRRQVATLARARTTN